MALSQFPSRYYYRVRSLMLLAALLFYPIAVFAEGEQSKREQRTMEAQQLLLEGDAAYQAGSYGDAVEKFRKAVDLIPDAPFTAELRAAAKERYTQAAAQQAQTLTRKGDLAAAKSMLDDAPDSVVKEQVEGKLDDPIHTNPASTKVHTGDVDKVRRTLYEAQGMEQLGKYDAARAMYEEVVRVDPYNRAARRGLEKIAQRKSDYHKSSSDHARAEMLAEVASAWETPVPAVDTPEELALLNSYGVNNTSMFEVSRKLKDFIVPSVDMQDVSLQEAIDYLRDISRQLDDQSIPGPQRGINFVISMGLETSPAAQAVNAIRINLSLKNTPLVSVLKYICDQSRTTYTADESAVTIRPLGAEGNELVTRSYNVPPDFLTIGASKENVETAAPDPFSNTQKKEGVFAVKLTAVEVLKQAGIQFPEGSSASFNPSNSSLLVRNVLSQHELVQQFVDTLTQNVPISVVVKFTLISTQQHNLEELGFDSMLNDFKMGDTFLGGGTAAGADMSDLVRAGSEGQDPATAPITAGNRSGATAIDGNSIDAVIAAENTGAIASKLRAPGVISLLGRMDKGKVSLLMRGLSQKKDVSVMQKPSIVTRSGETAKIEVIREFIYATEYEPPELPNSIGSSTLGDLTTGQVVSLQPPTPITPATPTAFETKPVGTTLEVNAVVSEDHKYINLTLQPTFINFDGFINYGSPINGGGVTGTDFFNTPAGSPINATGVTGKITDNRILMPVFSRTSANTKITIADGATIALGGLMEERIQLVEDKVPFLGSIPYFGRLFQSKALAPIKKNIIMLVNVELVDATGRPVRQTR